MSKEKQIEEIKLLLESTCDNTECNYPFNCDLCQATRLYTAGYRKQSEGEWLRFGQDDVQCSLCGKVNTNCNNNNFCPNCGAKMKGGEE